MKKTLLLTTALTMGVAATFLLPVDHIHAEDCLLDRDNDGVVDVTTDTYGAANSNDQNEALACGIRATATGTQATSVGTDFLATGNFSVAVGNDSDATQTSSTAVGYFAGATGEGSSAVGRSAVSSGNQSVALGFNTDATARGSIAIGGDGFDSDSAGAQATSKMLSPSELMRFQISFPPSQWAKTVRPRLTIRLL